MTKPENEDTWDFEVAPAKSLKLVTLEEKKSYAYFCLSVSLYLQGYGEGAEIAVKNSHDLNATRQADINALLTADLDALVQSNGSFAQQIAAYKQLYLYNL